MAWSDFLIFITRVDIAEDIINASESNGDCSEPVASTNLDNEVMQQDFVFEDEENNQVRNAKTKKIFVLGMLDIQLWLLYVFLWYQKLTHTCLDYKSQEHTLYQ